MWLESLRQLSNLTSFALHSAKEFSISNSQNDLSGERIYEIRRVIGGRIVLTPDAETPYKVVLQYLDGEDTEHPFQTMREGEAFIRGEFPVPRGTSRPWRTPQT